MRFRARQIQRFNDMVAIKFIKLALFFVLDSFLFENHWDLIHDALTLVVLPKSIYIFWVGGCLAKSL